MKKRYFVIPIIVLTVTGCMSSSEPQGPQANAWEQYRSWFKVTPEPNTGDPTGFLGNVHEGLNAYRDIYVNSAGLDVNQGETPFPYPQGSILVKETYRNLAAYNTQQNPDLTIMVKLLEGSSPETSDWEYIMGADGLNRGTGTSGVALFCHSCHTAAAATDYNFINAKFLNSH